jgi:hypothetical protein
MTNTVMVHITAWEEDYKGNNTSPSLQSPLANSSSPSCTSYIIHENIQSYFFRLSQNSIILFPDKVNIYIVNKQFYAYMHVYANEWSLLNLNLPRSYYEGWYSCLTHSSHEKGQDKVMHFHVCYLTLP